MTYTKVHSDNTNYGLTTCEGSTVTYVKYCVCTSVSRFCLETLVYIYYQILIL
jgi:hypothetical protein